MGAETRPPRSPCTPVPVPGSAAERTELHSTPHTGTTSADSLPKMFANETGPAAAWEPLRAIPQTQTQSGTAHPPYLPAEPTQSAHTPFRPAPPSPAPALASPPSNA